jgi:hypothetical protein
MKSEPRRYREKKSGRVVIVTGEFDDGPNDNGFEYQFEDGAPGKYWIRTASSAVRWENLDANDQRTDT